MNQPSAPVSKFDSQWLISISLLQVLHKALIKTELTSDKELKIVFNEVCCFLEFE